MAKKVTVIKAAKAQKHTQEERRLKVCGYARVSTGSQAQATSYTAQVEYYTEKIESNPLWEFAGVYADKGISGTNVKHRDEFQMMISDCEDGNVGLILTKSITRFAKASCSLPSWHRWRRGNQKTSQATTDGRYRNAFRMEPISYPRQRMAMEKTRMEI